MNGTFDGTFAAARDRMTRYHREAEIARALRQTSDADSPTSGSFAQPFRRRLARGLMALAERLDTSAGVT